MNKKLTDAQDIILSRINHISGKLGLNNIMAQLYALLYMSDKPLSLGDMSERLKISKASASINIRALERYNAVRKIWVKGSRKDYYEAEADITKVVKDRVRLMTENRLSEMENMINTSYNELNSVASPDKEENDGIKFFSQRLERLRDLNKKAKTILEFIA